MNPKDDRLPKSENKDIIEFLTPLREPVASSDSEDRLNNLLTLAKDLGPKVTLLGMFLAFVRKFFKHNPLLKILIIGLVVSSITLGIVSALGLFQPSAPNVIVPTQEPGLSVEEPPSSTPTEEVMLASGTDVPSPTAVVPIVTETSTAVPPTATSEPTATATQCSPPENWVQYIVRPGDTFYSIARATGATVEGLQVANCLPSPERIFPGQIMYLPIPYPTETPTKRPTTTPSLTPTSTPTEVSSLITIMITSPEPNEIVTGVGNTRFGAIVYDEAYGSNDGDGIVSVTFSLSGPNNYSHILVDTTAPFCEFGDGDPCLTMGNSMWSGLITGNYTLMVSAVSLLGNSRDAKVDFTINLPQ